KQVKVHFRNTERTGTGLFKCQQRGWVKLRKRKSLVDLIFTVIGFQVPAFHGVQRHQQLFSGQQAAFRRVKIRAIDKEGVVVALIPVSLLGQASNRQRIVVGFFIHPLHGGRQPGVQSQVGEFFTVEIHHFLVV